MRRLMALVAVMTAMLVTSAGGGAQALARAVEKTRAAGDY